MEWHHSSVLTCTVRTLLWCHFTLKFYLWQSDSDQSDPKRTQNTALSAAIYYSVLFLNLRMIITHHSCTCNWNIHVCTNSKNADPPPPKKKSYSLLLVSEAGIKKLEMKDIFPIELSWILSHVITSFNTAQMFYF